MYPVLIVSIKRSKTPVAPAELHSYYTHVRSPLHILRIIYF